MRHTRYAVLIEGPEGWQALRNPMDPCGLYERMSQAMAALEARGHDDWTDIGVDPNVLAELEFADLPIPIDAATVYAGPTRRAQGRLVRSAILELGPEALEGLGYFERHACPAEGCQGSIRVPKSITPDIYMCPCGAKRIHVRLPRYGERPESGKRFILEVVE